MTNFEETMHRLQLQHEQLLTRKNMPTDAYNGIFTRYRHPILTAAHTPLFWRYDLDPATNPYCMERIGINAVMNSGAIKFGGKYLLVVRVEGADRKSFFAVAESPNGIDNFRFRDYPVTMPEYGEPATNIYDMRLTAHEDGWIYGIFCVERKDPAAAPGDLSSAVAAAGIARTKNLVDWERLPDLKSSSQQRNVVLHPEFVDGKYALYTRPQDGFIDTGNGGGLGRGGLCRSSPSAGPSSTTSRTPKSRASRSSTGVTTIRSKRRKTAKAPIRSKHPGDGCTWHTAYEPAPRGCAMCSTST